MRIAVLGTGIVGSTLASKLVAGGHEVRMGSRVQDNEKAAAWAAQAGSGASHGTFADAAAFGEVVVNCTAGAKSVDALRLAGSENLAGKILIDVANPLDFSRGMPPTLTVCNTESLAEQIQRELPDARVIKALNTINCDVMVEPARVPGEHHVFVCGDDAAARAQVARWLGEWFGWPAGRVLDLGGLASARGMEMYVIFWVSLLGATGTPFLNIQVNAQEAAAGAAVAGDAVTAEV